MDVLFTLIPGHGHFFPILPLARALRSAGNRVRFATSASYAATIESYGFPVVPAGLDYTQATAKGDADTLEEIDLRVARTMFEAGPPAMLESLATLLTSDRPDVMLVDPWEFGGQVAAERAGIPWGAVIIGVRGSGSLAGVWPFDFDERERVLAEKSNVGRMRRLRSLAGLEPSRLFLDERPFDRTLALCQAPPSLEAWPHSWLSPTAHPLRPEVHRSDSDDTWLEGLPSDRPVISVSFGTLFGTIEVERAAVEAALATGATVVAVTRREIGVDHPRLHSTPWVSMDRLMVRTDVLVHHGGWGSTVAGIATGTPAAVVPLGAEQIMQGARLASVGAAVLVDRETMTVDGLSSDLERLLDDPVFGLNARRLQDEIAAMPGPADVIPLIEQLAETGGPVLNRDEASVS